MTLRQSVGDIGCTVLAIFRTRLELAAVEAGQQKARLAKIMVLLFGALLFSTLALLVFTLFIALLFWPTEYRYWAIASLFVVYAVLGVSFGLIVMRRLNSGSYPFEATVEEIKKDIQVIENLRQSSRDEAKGGDRE
ncbi:phage holin family protein [Paenalcaligenes suwonensis]|uniref:phage holin family protein n=1 Tax=Paenalcaligenes suwonensis TaxID=1202713 RepID=UPI00140D7B27|nr:phage holin family protein [Paenalcaligenes suwonensis]NHC60666.1 phage holin family protein [Paenalcaligenes suwonensis]